MLSYAHDDERHVENVRRFWAFLRSVGIDAHLDLPADEEPQDWPLWMLRQIRLATFILIIASPEYRRRAEGEASPDEGRGVQFEARIIRDEVYADQDAARNRFLPVLLPGGSIGDIPVWLGRAAATHYAVSAYTKKGSEKLLRFLTGQPHETVPALGAVPIFRPHTVSAKYTETGAQNSALIREVTERSPRRNEAILQAQVRQLLASGPLGLTEDNLGVDLATQAENRRRIDISIGSTIIEVRADLRTLGAREAAEHALAPYVARRSAETGRRYAALITDGAEWYLYRLTGHRLELADERVVDPADPDLDRLLDWLEALLATGGPFRPTPEHIAAKLGANSPAHILDFTELADLYEEFRNLPNVDIKRRLWSKLLTTASGTNFTDEDSLFVNHTLLVIMAEVIAHAVVGIAPDASDITAREITSGDRFSASDIRGVIEPDFFDWVVEVPGGSRFVKSIAQRLMRFSWNAVEHDVMKILYESIISSETRHRLGEYYTPDWLAKVVISECVDDPLEQRVLDASCGSGTFLFHATRFYLSASESFGISNNDAIRGLAAHVVGIDVHPVAVTLARVTYLLAIGMERLQAEGRPAFAVPVYLGDALRWGEESTLLSYPGLSVSTSENSEIFQDPLESPGDQLLFPNRVVDDAGRFDQLVSELADRATSRRRGSDPPSIAVVLERFDIDEDDRPPLVETFRKMCALHDEDRDHIWAYYVRNLARPLWLSRSENRIDVLVGNPPWLAYRYMTQHQRIAFRAMSKERGLWTGATMATSQDLSALFVARCIELYLRPGGEFGYVMPLATLSRRQYVGFRTGQYPVRSGPIKVAFDRPWDLHRVRPSFFPVPASVVFGQRVTPDVQARQLTQTPEVWTGRIRTDSAAPSDPAASLGHAVGEEEPRITVSSSPYAARFSQGATMVPRVLLMVEPDKAPRLGSGPGKRPVRSNRKSREKSPWKEISSLRGVVEQQFIRPVLVGESLLPFRCHGTAEAIIPWNGQRLIHGGDDELDRFRGLAKWWRSAEETWNLNRASDRMGLIERIDFRRGLSRQFPIPDLRVAYAASGMYMAAAIIADSAAVVEHKLYWATPAGLDEARFLTAILNSTSLTLAVRPLQGRGENNPRDFDKYVWHLPIPIFDPDKSAHRRLADLAKRAEQVASNLELPPVRFEALRRRVREALERDGVMADIDAAVKALLDY